MIGMYRTLLKAPKRNGKLSYVAQATAAMESHSSSSVSPKKKTLAHSFDSPTPLFSILIVKCINLSFFLWWYRKSNFLFNLKRKMFSLFRWVPFIVCIKCSQADFFFSFSLPSCCRCCCSIFNVFIASFAICPVVSCLRYLLLFICRCFLAKVNVTLGFSSHVCSGSNFFIGLRCLFSLPPFSFALLLCTFSPNHVSVCGFNEPLKHTEKSVYPENLM